VGFLILLVVLGAVAYRITSTEERGRYLEIGRDVLAQLKAAAMRPRPEVDAFRLVLQARMRYPIVTSTIAVLNLIVALALLFAAGAILWFVNDRATAQAEADAALKKFPNDRMVKLAHASLLADMGKTDDAVAELRTLLTGDHDRETNLTIAQMYEKGKRYSDMAGALDAAEKLSQSKQDKQTVIFMRGAMLEKMKNFEAAEAEFRKVLALEPDNASALNYLGYMLADRHERLDEAQKMISRAVELDPQNGAYLDSLGWVYYQQNRLDQAADYLQRAVQRISKDPTIHDHLGDVYFKQGKIREAVAQWENSLKEVESNSQADIEPAEVASINKKLEGARVRMAKEALLQKEKQR